MVNKNKKNKYLICALLLTVFFTSCPVADEFTELPWTYPPGVTSKEAYTNGKTVKIALSVNGSEDPLVALRYRMATNFGPYYFDYVVLCSAKMVKKENTSGSGFTFNIDLSDVKSILDRRSSTIAPLQSKGMKVLLQIENNGEGFTFANLPPSLIYPFAQTCKNILVQYNLDGFEFNDVNGDDPVNGLYAYPSLGISNYYDGIFDNFPAYNESAMGDRLDIATAVIPRDLDEPANGNNWSFSSDQAKVEYFWLNGAHAYGTLLSYFRSVPVWQDPNAPDSSIIGELEDKPILVRETGFASGRDDLEDVLNSGDLYAHFKYRNSYMSQWIDDPSRPTLDFTGILAMVNVFMSSHSAPDFGWKNTVTNQYTGKSIMTFVSHDKYCPGILDLGTALTDEEIRFFSTEFANGNMANDDIEHGVPYSIFYYTNVGNGGNVAARLSISSRIVYGGRQEQDYELTGLLNNGPEIVYVP